MHDLPVTPDRETDGRPAAEPTRPTAPPSPLLRLGAPIVGDLESAVPPPAAPTAPPADVPGEHGATHAATQPSTDALRRAALLRLVGLGRSRTIR